MYANGRQNSRVWIGSTVKGKRTPAPRTGEMRRGWTYSQDGIPLRMNANRVSCLDPWCFPGSPRTDDNKNKTQYCESGRFPIPAEKITHRIDQNHDKSCTCHDISWYQPFFHDSLSIWYAIKQFDNRRLQITELILSGYMWIIPTRPR